MTERTRHPARVGIDGQPDRVHAAVELVVRIGRDLDLQRLPDPIGRRVGLGNIGEQPHGRDVRDRVWRRRVAGLNVKTRPGIARRDAARDRAVDDQDRIDFPFFDHPVHLGVGLAEDAHRVAGRSQVAFRRLLVRRRLLVLLLRPGPGLVQGLGAGQIAGREVENAGCGNQRRGCLHQVGAVDREQDLPLLHFIAQLCGQLHDAARIWREHLDGHVLVEVDAADGRLLDREFTTGNHLGLDGRDVPFGQLEAVHIERIWIGRAAGGPACFRLGAGGLRGHARRAAEILDVCCKISTPREARQRDRGNCP